MVSATRTTRAHVKRKHERDTLRAVLVLHRWNRARTGCSCGWRGEHWPDHVIERYEGALQWHPVPHPGCAECERDA